MCSKIPTLHHQTVCSQIRLEISISLWVQTFFSAIEANQVSSSTDDKTSTEKSQTCPWPPVVPSSSRPVRSRIIDDDAPSSSGSSSGAGPSSGRVMEDSEENEADTGDEDYKPTKEEEESEDEDVDDQ